MPDAYFDQVLPVLIEGPTELMCLICGRFYKYRFNVKKHLANKHNIREKIETRVDGECDKLEESREQNHFCPCGKKYSNRDSLRFHMHLKHGVALPPDKQLTYSCSICGMGYIYEKNYKRHLQKHESGELNELGNEKHSCDICGNVYAHKFTLIVHLREKHGESGEIVIKKKKSIWKPYKCQFCQMPFRRYMSLYSHQVREHPETRVDISSPSSLSYLLSLHTLLSNQSSTQKKDSKEKKPSFLIKDIIDIDG